jgi:hypothetical protein
MSYLTDVDIEHDDDGDIEIETNHYDPEQRARLHEHGEQWLQEEWLQEVDPSHIRGILGR